MTNIAGDFVPASPEPLKPLRLERRRVWQSVLLSAVIFLAGGASGWGLAVALAPPRPAGPQGMPPDPPVQDVVNRLRQELLLSPEQVGKVQEIYQKRFTELKAIREAMAPKLTTEYAQLKADIEKVLTPEQFASWDRRFETMRTRMLPPPPPPRARPDGPRNGPSDNEGMNPGNSQEDFGPGREGPPGPQGPGRRPPPPPDGSGPRSGDGQGPGGPGMPPEQRPGN